jgi:predicted ATPase
VAWSFELLDDAGRRLLARLSVLRGGFELDTAERVAGGGPLAAQAVAGLLAGLAGKSVVQVQAGATVRYWLLETIRQFAAARLAESGEETAAYLRLLSWALDMAPLGGGDPGQCRMAGLG